MRLAHISDLHLGKRVNEFSMLEDQRYIVKQIESILEEEAADAVLIAGDVYDKPVPPGEAVRLFDGFLTALADRGINVFVISGNHDSPERIAFGSRLMEKSRVYMAPVYDGHVSPIELRDAYGSVYVYMLPFVKPAVVKKCWPEEGIETYEDAVGCAVAHMKEEVFVPEARNVLVAHQLVIGASRCDSEEVSVGGLDQVSAALFRDFDYTALGHIHGPQNAGGERIRYCGSPLKYSFSEAGHVKSVTIVDLEEKGNVRVRTRPLIPLHDMREIRGSYEEVVSRDFYRGTAVDDYLHITLTDEEDILDAMGKLRAIYPNIMRLDYDNRRTREGGQLPEKVQRAKSPLELLEELYALQNNQPMSGEQRELSARLIEELWEDRA